MNVNNPAEFQRAFMSRMSFQSYPQKHFTLYKNPEKPEFGYYIHYSRPGYFEFGLADYTIPEDFKFHFYNPYLTLKFGTVYMGISKFKIDNEIVSSFTPSSFFILEKEVKGTQVWKKGQHFHGAEVTIHQKYFDDVLEKNHPNQFDSNQFLLNHTYRYLPQELKEIIEKLQTLAETNTLNGIFLEGKILEGIGILLKELENSQDNAFSKQIDYGHVIIGADRKINLTKSDVMAIQKAHQLIVDNPINTPTIKTLSKLVFLNEQKLKAGFSKYYHMPIGQFTNSVRMNIAANLLSTTDQKIDEIAKRVGYQHTSNFIRNFKQYYNQTPHAFRKNGGSLSL